MPLSKLSLPLGHHTFSSPKLRFFANFFTTVQWIVRYPGLLGHRGARSRFQFIVSSLSCTSGSEEVARFCYTTYLYLLARRIGLRRSKNCKTEPSEFCLVATLVFHLSYRVSTLQVSIWSFWMTCPAADGTRTCLAPRAGSCWLIWNSQGP